MPALGTPFSDRAYQVRGVGNVVAGLWDGGRGQLRAACGTGKTKMSQWAAQHLVRRGGVVVIVAPTIGLVAQTLDEWKSAHANHRVLAVCSDPTVADDEAAHTEDFLEPVTTDANVVDAWLRMSDQTQTSLIVGTHASADTIGEGLQKAATYADLLVVDEAHRSAGWSGKRTALIHDDEVIPTLRRLYMTATARVWASAKASDSATYSMDDEDVFGPVLFDYPFSEAISDGWLDDYRLAVIGVTRAEVLAVLRRAKASATHLLPSEHAAMVQAATVRAVTELGLRRVLAFCPRVAAAKQFAETFPAMIKALPSQLRPSRPLNAEYVEGRMKQDARRDVLSRLATPPDDGWSVVSNARCLSEGIDVPSVDGVAFTAPKDSVVDIVQAVGRALRRDPDGSGTATIIVPILLPDDFTGSDDDIDPGSYETLWQVVRALRAHNDLFAEELDTCRANGFPPGTRIQRIEFMLPDGVNEPQFLEHLTIRIVKSGTSPWWDGYAALCAYHAKHGNCLVPGRYTNEDGYNLGQWVLSQRSAHRGRRLSPDRADALGKLGFVFDSRDDKWEKNYAAAAAYRRQHGHLNPDKTVPGVDGIRLVHWLLRQRKHELRGALSEDRKTRLDLLGIQWFDRDWQNALVDVRAHYQRYGQILNHRYSPIRVEQRELRAAHDAKQLPADVENELEKLGMTWTRTDVDWWVGFRALTEFHTGNGHANPPTKFVTAQGFDLGYWACRERTKMSEHSEQQRAALAELGFVESPTKAHWEFVFAAAEKFVAEHGHLRPSGSVVVDSPYMPGKGTPLKGWLRSQDTARRQGTLARDRERRLTALGVEWAGDERWVEAAKKLRDYHAEHQHLPAGAFTPVSGALATLRMNRTKGLLPADVVAEMDGLGITWDPPDDATWREGYERLCRRYADLGHTAASGDACMPDGYAIGRWSKAMRIAYLEGSLAADRVEALQRIEFPFEMDTRDKWELAFTAVEAFHARNGHLQVPQTLQIANVKLRAWLTRQRDDHRAGILSAERHARLTTLGMQWGPGLALTDRLPEIEAFHATHGHLPTLSTHRSFAWTVSSMRTAYREGRLPAAAARSLESMGVDWENDPPDEPLDEPSEASAPGRKPPTRGEELRSQLLCAAARFRKQHGHLLPQPNMASDVVIGNKRMSQWLQVVRRDYKAGHIDPGLFHQLNDLGMVWQVIAANWEAGLAACATFFTEHGHLQVPTGYTYTNLRGEQASLNRWLHYHRHRRDKLSEQQIAQLDDVGMDWDPYTSLWQTNAEELTLFHAEHGHLDVPPGIIASNGVSLLNVLNYCRTQYRDGTLPPERRAALDALGMVWTAEQNPSRGRMLAALRQFHAQHGHIKVPADLRASNGAVVSYWLTNQRTKRRKNKLPAEEIAELDALGMNWRLGR